MTDLMDETFNVFKRRALSSEQLMMLCNTGEGALVKTYYETFVESSNIMAVFNVTAEHTFVRSE